MPREEKINKFVNSSIIYLFRAKRGLTRFSKYPSILCMGRQSIEHFVLKFKTDNRTDSQWYAKKAFLDVDWRLKKLQTTPFTQFYKYDVNILL